MSDRVPNGGVIVDGQVWTAAQWNNAWTAKIDATAGYSLNQALDNPTLNNPTLNGATYTGTQNFTTLGVTGVTTLSGGGSLGGTFTGSPILNWTPTWTGLQTFGAGATVTGGTFTSGAASSQGAALFFGKLDGTSIPLKVSASLILSGSTSPQLNRTESSLSGTTSAAPSLVVNSLTDNVAAAAGMNWTFTGVNYGGSGFTGGRNGQWINVNSTADSPNGSNSFLVAAAPWWRASHWNGGYPGSEKAAIFGTNPLGWLGKSGSIGARGFRGVQGAEIDCGAQVNALYRICARFVEWGSGGSNPGKGLWGDAAMSIGQITSQGMPGFDTFIALRDPIGDWALASNGVIMEVGPTQIGSPSTVAGAVGIDLTGAALSTAAWRSDGLTIDGSGNLGGQTVAGITLETRSVVQAQTATLASVTVVRGGRFDAAPTLTVDAPPGSGSTATATVATMGINAPKTLNARGTGYIVNDVLTLSGGTSTSAGQYTVQAVDSNGAIIDMSPTTVGSYSVLPSNPVTLTGGTGSGATVSPYWKILTVSTTAGSNYGSTSLPNIVPSGVGIYQNPILQPVMSATAATLVLNGRAVSTSAGSGALVTAGDTVAANSDSFVYSYLVGGTSGARSWFGVNLYQDTSGTTQRLNTAKNGWTFEHDTRSSTDTSLALKVCSSSGSLATAVTFDTGGGVTATTVTGTTVRTNGGSGPTWTAGNGAPATTTPRGSMYSRLDGGVGTTLYVSQGGGTWNAVAGV